MENQERNSFVAFSFQFHYRAMQHEEAKNQIVVYSTKSSSHLVLCYMVILNIGSEITKASKI